MEILLKLDTELMENPVMQLILLKHLPLAHQRLKTMLSLDSKAPFLDISLQCTLLIDSMQIPIEKFLEQLESNIRTINAYMATGIKRL